MSFSVWSVHTGAGTSGVQKRTLSALELELRVVRNCRKWLLQLILGSSARTQVFIAAEPSNSPLLKNTMRITCTSVPGIQFYIRKLGLKWYLKYGLRKCFKIPMAWRITLSTCRVLGLQAYTTTNTFLSVKYV